MGNIFSRFTAYLWGNSDRSGDIQSKGTYESYPQKRGTVGLAFIITNGYEGENCLPGTEHDHTKWEDTLKKLKFDVRTLRNASKDKTRSFLDAASKIQVDGKICNFVIFVFSGHGGEGVLYSHNSEEMSMENDILPFFFGNTNFRTVEKLFFLDACRVKGRNYQHLGDALAKVWNCHPGVAGYFCLTSSPSGNVSRDGQLGSTFSDVVTTKLLEPITLDTIVCETRVLLEEEATEKQQSFINPYFENQRGPRSEKILSKLSKRVPGPVDSKPDMGDNQPDGGVQVKKSTSTIPDVLKEKIRKHDSYQKILTNKVARPIGLHLNALARNLGVDSGGFIANHPHNMKDAAAALLIHWAEGNTGKTPIWSDLLEAMRESDMTKEADELEEYLTGSS